MKLPDFLKHPRKWLVFLLPLALFLGGWWFGLPPAEKEGHEHSADSNEVWTCSMHPQIRQPNPGLCPICNMDLIPLQDDSGGGLREVAVSDEAAALLDIRVTPVRRAPAQADIRLFGRIDYDERRITSVTARMDGRLDRLFVDFTGARVRKGDHLAEIYSPELFVAQKELIEAHRAFGRLDASASSAVRDTRRRLLESSRERLRLLQLSDEQVLRIENKAEPSPTLQIDSPQDGVVVEKVVNEGSYVKTGDAILRVADLSSVWLKVEAYESDLPWLRYGQTLEFTVDSIPGRTFHGRIAFIDPDLDAMRRVASVRVNVDNPDGLLKPGVFAKVRVSSRMTAGGRVIDPQLDGKWISPMHPEIVKDGPGQCDICGMDLVPAESLGFLGEEDQHREPLLIPRSAVLQTGDRALVYVRLPEEDAPVFEGRQVVLGPAVGSEFIVREGLAEGELVVSRGAFKLDSELQIKGKPSMMNDDAGLEERPAGEASEDLLGQWSPLLRGLDRLRSAARAGNRPAMKEQLNTMRAAVESIRTEAMQPDDLKRWNEFSNRLLVDLNLALQKADEDPQIAYGIVARAIEKAGRHLGVPYQPTETPATDPRFVEHLKRLVAAYLPIARSLADDDEASSKQASEAFAKEVAATQLPDSDELKKASTLLARAADLKSRRTAFDTVSQQMIALVRAHGIDRLGDLYIVHCPMAFGNQGADWLSSLPEVLNPYYGDAMLTCGSLKDTLSVKKGGEE
ncbi:efflux RND transporter periplasmic adaptor subunit [Haloferula chungangensis]|uniref:Efflux RND transporter periplasmic adaptor subunit n=1 Tax=Haloferula chungangensis TaxID=1048331 RepID=A0ABW2L887_9BACT